MDTNQPQPSAEVFDPRAYAANLMIQQKQGSGEVIEALLAKGLTYEEAEDIVRDLLGDARALVSKNARKNIGWGLFWLVLGLLATLISQHRIYIGAMVIGAIRLFIGFRDSANT